MNGYFIFYNSGINMSRVIYFSDITAIIHRQILTSQCLESDTDQSCLIKTPQKIRLLVLCGEVLSSDSQNLFFPDRECV